MPESNLVGGAIQAVAARAMPLWERASAASLPADGYDPRIARERRRQWRRILGSSELLRRRLRATGLAPEQVERSLGGASSPAAPPSWTSCWLDGSKTRQPAQWPRPSPNAHWLRNARCRSKKFCCRCCVWRAPMRRREPALRRRSWANGQPSTSSGSFWPSCLRRQPHLRAGFSRVPLSPGAGVGARRCLVAPAAIDGNLRCLCPASAERRAVRSSRTLSRAGAAALPVRRAMDRGNGRSLPLLRRGFPGAGGNIRNCGARSGWRLGRDPHRSLRPSSRRPQRLRMPPQQR